MLRYFFILLVITGLLPAAGVWAQQGLSKVVTIKGKADSSYLSATNSIFVYTYDDYISFREKELAKGQLSEDGSFVLSFSVSKPTPVFLIADNARAEMVVEPNITYDINVLAKDSDAVNTLSSSIPVGMQFNNSDRTELNYLIADFTVRYETMLEDYQGNISRKESSIFKKIDTLELLFKKKYAAYNNTYLNNYIHYTFAFFEDNTTLKNKENLYKEHIAGKPVQLNDQSYMTFFNQFFSVTSNYFMNNSKMLMEVNNKQNFSSLMDFLKQSSLLTNDTIREAVLLKSLAEYFRYPDYKTNAVLALLDQATKQCKTPENRKAAENLKRKLSVMNIGKPAPALAFLDMEGKPVSLSDFKGKYIYINFWATWCSSCTQDMTLIPELKKSYGGKIIFLSISVDKKQELVKNFLKKNPRFGSEKNNSGWIFLFSDNYKKVKEEFNVLTVPAYFLIDPKGNVLKAPAAKPEDVEPEMMEIRKRK